MNRVSIKNPYFWMITIFVVGIIYLLSLQLPIKDGVYFTGDSGLKAMITQNLAAGNLVFDLNLPNPPWIKTLWAEGMFPYDEPFVYQLDGKQYITFPYTFSLVTAPLYALLGYRGLYLIPLLATVMLWLVFYKLCNKLDFAPAAIAVGGFFLIFATNLSFFSATYWEHTLSVCLAFTGLSYFFPEKGSKHIRVWTLIGSGILTGLAFWFRPEQVFLVVYLAAICLFSFGKAVWNWRSEKYFDFGKIPDFIGKKGWAYLAASTITLMLYGMTNWLIYKNIFGVHSIQVLESKPFLERLTIFLNHVRQMTIGDTSFFMFNPISLFLIGYLFFALVKRDRTGFKKDWAIWYFFCPVFFFGVSILVPAGSGGKQWGPRFLLLLVPIIVLLFTWQLSDLINKSILSKPIIRWVVVGSILIIGVFGLIQDTFRGRNYLIYNYNLVQPAVEALLSDPEPLIAVSNNYLSQVFQPALGRKVIFLGVRDENELTILSKSLLDQGQETFTYICYSFDCKLFDSGKTDFRIEYGKAGFTIQTLKVKDYGKYTIRKMQVRSGN